MPRSTIYGVLRRQRVPRLADLDRPTQRPLRYERARPGELGPSRCQEAGPHPSGRRASPPGARQRGITIQAVMTDRAFAYTKAHAFRTTRVQLGIRHLVTRPYRPQTNGKAERFIQTLIHE